MLVYPIHIDATNDSINFYPTGEGSPPVEVDLEHGTYWPYWITETASTAVHGIWPSLYIMIKDALESYIGGTWEVHGGSDPTLSTQQDGRGLEITWYDAPEAYWAVTAGRLGEFYPHILGGLREEDEEFGIATISSPYCRSGVWAAPPHSMPRIRGDIIKEQTRNNARRGNGVTTRWGTDEVRLLEHRWVPAGHVRRRITDRADFAAAAQVAQGDYGNSWSDLWERGISTYEDVIRVEDGVLGAADHPWEVLFSLRGSRYADELSSTLSERDEGAHVYRVEVAMGRVPYSTIEGLGVGTDHRELYIREL